MEGWEIIQSCEITGVAGHYNKKQFTAAIEHLTPHEFNLFCRTYLHLTEFYSKNQGAWVTDYPPLVAANPDLYWQLEPIDFNEPVNFIRRK